MSSEGIIANCCARGVQNVGESWSVFGNDVQASDIEVDLVEIPTVNCNMLQGQLRRQDQRRINQRSVPVFVGQVPPWANFASISFDGIENLCSGSDIAH